MPFVGIKCIFAWQAIIVYFLLCRMPTINVQAKFCVNNFGLYINSQRKNQYLTCM